MVSIVTPPGKVENRTRFITPVSERPIWPLLRRTLKVEPDGWRKRLSLWRKIRRDRHRRPRVEPTAVAIPDVIACPACGDTFATAGRFAFHLSFQHQQSDANVDAILASLLADRGHHVE